VRKIVAGRGFAGLAARAGGLVLLATAIVTVAACSPTAAPTPTAAAAKPAAGAPTTAAAPAKAAGPSTVIRVGCSDPEGSSSPALTIGKFAELATKKSNGELDVKAFYTSLGVEQSLLEAVKVGSVDAGQITTANAARFTDAFTMFDLPFLVKNDAALSSLFKTTDIGKKLAAQFEKDAGVKVLLWMSHGFDATPNSADVQTRNKELRVPADIKGLKIRTNSSPVALAVVKAWGGNPTPVDWGQLYSAMQQGVVDGTLGSPMVPYTSIKLQEVTKHYLAIGAMTNNLPLYINQKKFDSLTPSQQKAILDAAAETEAFSQEAARDLVKKSTADVEKAGVKIYTPKGAELAEWTSIREPVWKQIASEMQGKIDLSVAETIYKSDLGASKR